MPIIYETIDFPVNWTQTEVGSYITTRLNLVTRSLPHITSVTWSVEGSKGAQHILS